jgi:hypothetical protein
MMPVSGLREQADACSRGVVRTVAGVFEKLEQNPGVRPQDVFINLVEVAKENGSFGKDKAQHV